MKWLDKVADVVLGVHRLANLVRILLAALAAAAATSVAPPAEPPAVVYPAALCGS